MKQILFYRKNTSTRFGVLLNTLFISGMLGLIGTFANAEQGEKRSIVINTTPEIIHIQLDDVEIGEVLDQISKETGIIFKFNTAIENQKLTENYQAKDWRKVLAHLLKDYSYVIKKKDGQIAEVILAGSNNGGAATVNSGAGNLNNTASNNRFNQRQEQASNESNFQRETHPTSSSSENREDGGSTIAKTGSPIPNNYKPTELTEEELKNLRNNVNDSKLTSDEIKLSRSVSNALLVARREEKKNIQSEIKKDMESINQMKRMLERLEAAAMAETYSIEVVQREGQEEISSATKVNLAENSRSESHFTSIQGGSQPAPTPVNPMQEPSLNSNDSYQYIPEPDNSPQEDQRLSASTHQIIQAAIDTFDARKNYFENQMLEQGKNDTANTNSTKAMLKQRRNERLVDVTTEAKTALLAMKENEKIDLDKIETLQAELSMETQDEQPKEPEPTFQTLTRHR